MKAAATNGRTFRTFLLMSQLQAQEIGQRIKQKRLERGMTQDDLASLTTFSARSLQDYENGVTIPYKHFTEIGKLLNARPEWLMYGEDEPPGSSRLEQEPGPQSTEDLVRQVLQNQHDAVQLLEGLAQAVDDAAAAARANREEIATMREELQAIHKSLEPQRRQRA